MSGQQDRRRIRDRLSEAQNHRCCYCFCRMDGVGEEDNAPTIEHAVPRAHGGRNSQDNLVVACSRCNKRVGAMTYRAKVKLSRAAAEGRA